MSQTIDVENGKSVLYWTASWCGPCQQIKPAYEKIVKEAAGKGIKFYKLELDDNQEMAQQLEVKSIPTFFFIKQGEVLQKFSGASEAKLKAGVEALIKA